MQVVPEKSLVNKVLIMGLPKLFIIHALMKRSLFLFINFATCNDDDADKMKD